MWLKYDEEKGMICKWCVENKQTLVTQNVVNFNRSINFIVKMVKIKDDQDGIKGGGGGTFWRVKTGLGKRILRVTRPNGECSQNLVSNPAQSTLTF